MAKNEIVYPIDKTEEFIVKNIHFWAGCVVGAIFGMLAITLAFSCP